MLKVQIRLDTVSLALSSCTSSWIDSLECSQLCEQYKSRSSDPACRLVAFKSVLKESMPRSLARKPCAGLARLFRACAVPCRLYHAGLTDPYRLYHAGLTDPYRLYHAGLTDPYRLYLAGLTDPYRLYHADRLDRSVQAVPCRQSDTRPCLVSMKHKTFSQDF